MGMAQPTERDVFHWLPTNDGFQRVRFVLRELAGLLLGA